MKLHYDHKGEFIMSVLKIGTQKHTKVVCLDETALGSRVCHEYYFCRAKEQDDVDVLAGEFGHVQFQNGPIKEAGINGCHQEDLLAVVIDRLRYFQTGEYACRENAIALTHCEDALRWLRHRTNARIECGVEGTSKK
jgi:hypothetical protein